MNNTRITYISLMVLGVGAIQQLNAVTYTVANMSNKAVYVSVDYDGGVLCSSDNNMLLEANTSPRSVREISAKACTLNAITIWFNENGKEYSYRSRTRYFAASGDARFSINVNDRNEISVMCKGHHNNKPIDWPGENRVK